jgi:hypothetical protein
VSEAPDFDLLPDEPEAFFGLEEDFTARELKRSYTRLIKRYKPDRDPEAFKQIRAAYEDLQPQASTVKRSRPSPPPAEEIAPEGEAPETAGESSARDSAPEDSPEEEARNEELPSEPEARVKRRGRALLAQIERHGLRRAYELLISKQPKEAEDYHHLAVLADLQPEPGGEGRRGFLDWILAGLRDHPDDEGLTGLLAALCRDGLPDEELSAGLERIAATLSPSRFYALSGPLWLAFLRTRPFKELRDQWERCELATRRRGLSDVAAPERLRLLVRLLRAAAWRADEAWLRETSEFLSRHHTRIPDEAQAELDFVELIRDYLTLRSRQLDQSEARARLDRILRAYCELPESPFDQVLFHELTALRQEGWSLLETFPPGDPTGGLAVSALEWASGEAEARRLHAPPTISESQLVGSLRRLEWGYASDFRWRYLSYFPRVGRAFVQVIGYLPSLALVVAAGIRRDNTLLVVAVVLALVFRILDQRQQLVARGRRRILQLTGSLLERLQAKLYATKLRPGLGEYLLRTRIPARAMASEIARQGEYDEWSWDPEWLADLVREDTGLTALSLARRFERP